ncbi:nucleolar protein 8 [Brachionichthys hirsutus]|uniref:nucleolar protein 8 n=1 Tax=Brachionichthys hirsutus TaxID=412623 RepID=UPI0036050A57
MQRLYVGGLSHFISQKDLKDRFSKFGVVEDVELRTRRDEDGNPYKTFAYINMKASGADLKRCLSVLNKSQWKGGTLHIETAKESFLHRLAQERQTLAERRLQQLPAEDKRQEMLDSMSRSGVKDFTMKAAVPGTVVPGHQGWVVSKFGRVLPVLQLPCQKGRRVGTVKYDPSKYSHNIHRLDWSTADQQTPVAQLTWEVPGGDDDISKKRRGEFPSYETSRRKKIRTEVVKSHNPVDTTRYMQTDESTHHAETHRFTSGCSKPTSHRLARPMRAETDGDIDSDKNISRMAEAQDHAHVSLQQEVDGDNLEVVGLDYLTKSHQKTKGEDDEDYDSADTDELLASRKPAPLQERPSLPTDGCLSRKESPEKRKKGNAREEEEDPAHGGRSDNKSENDEEESGTDSEYEALFSNVPHLKICLADLQRLVEESQPNASVPKTSVSSRSAGRPATTPEDILSVLMDQDSSEDEPEERTSKAVLSTPLPAFQGTGTRNEGPETEERQKGDEEEGQKRKLNDGHTTEGSEEEEEEEGEELSPSGGPLGPEEEEDWQRRANVRRLAAVQQRQMEAARHKKLIQGALSRLVSRVSQSAPHLFSSSEDEEDGDEEEAGKSFDLRPQFEGRAGQKLIELQSRFGPDQRFRMDARFLEEHKDKAEGAAGGGGPASDRRERRTEDDEALEGERTKNLSILQSVLGAASQTCSSKTASKARTFRDVSALHYDPSREEHAAFETRTVEPKQRGAARREEAQKIPEVSKEIYYNVSADLKAGFGQGGGPGGEEKTSWDKEDKEKPAEGGVAESLSDDPNTHKETPGFKFSFFGDEPEAGRRETEFQVESIQMPKLSWQQDPRFHDSSSDEEDEEQEEDRKQSSFITRSREDASSTTERFFFFCRDDRRLTDDPRLFCRSSHLEEQREQWEERRSVLRQECRKKHKDARRKLKSSHKEDHGK